MSSRSKVTLLALLFPLAACASASEPAAPGETAEGPTAHAREDLAICGERTAASIVDADGRRLTFCMTTHGREIIAEEAPDGVASVLSAEGSRFAATRREDCALDVFLAHTSADVPVPAVVKASCERRRGHAVDIGARSVSVKAVLQAAPVAAAAGNGVQPKAIDQVDVGTNTNGTKYCNTTTGPSAFVLDFCTSLCSGVNAPCVQACTPRYWSSSVRQCAESNDAFEDIVSCTGWTQVFIDARDGSGDPWSNELETFVGPNRHITAHIFKYGTFGEDSDLRIRGASEAGATHMHAFQCFDF